MPDPSVIAAQRKLELEQDNIASQIVSKKSQHNYCVSIIFSFISIFFTYVEHNIFLVALILKDDLNMCAPEELVLQRKLENNQETIIASIIHSINDGENLSNIETQLASDIKTLYSSVQDMKVLSENPGIDVNSVNFDDSDLPMNASEYLKKTHRSLIQVKSEEDLEYKLNCVCRFLHRIITCVYFPYFTLYTLLTFSS